MPRLAGLPLCGRLPSSLPQPYDSVEKGREAARDAGVVLAFGDHRLDIDRRELRRGGELVEIEPKAFDLLIYLVQNRDRVVSKDDLLTAVWDGRIVSESALTTRINAVRRAFAGSRLLQRFRHWIPASDVAVEEGIRMARQALAVARDNPDVMRIAGYALAALAG
jgi:hypothetical protein